MIGAMREKGKPIDVAADAVSLMLCLPAESVKKWQHSLLRNGRREFGRIPLEIGRRRRNEQRAECRPQARESEVRYSGAVRHDGLRAQEHFARRTCLVVGVELHEI